jgi:hypothetical protein
MGATPAFDRPSPVGAVDRMRWKFDTVAGRAIYSWSRCSRASNKGMRRFTPRGRRKVNAQWQLFTMVHNIERIAGVSRWGERLTPRAASGPPGDDV